MKKIFSMIALLVISASTVLVSANESVLPISDVKINNEANILTIEGYNVSDTCSQITLEILRDDAVWGIGSDGDKRVSEFDPETDSILDYLIWIDQIDNVQYKEFYKFVVPCFTEEQIPEFRVRFDNDKIVYFSKKTVEKINASTTTDELKNAVMGDDYVWGTISGDYNSKLDNEDKKQQFWQKLLDEKNRRISEGNAFSSTIEIPECVPDIINLILVNNVATTDDIEQILVNFTEQGIIESNSAELFSNTGEFADAEYLSAEQKGRILTYLFAKCHGYINMQEIKDDFSDAVLLYAVNNNKSKYYVEKILKTTDRIDLLEIEKYNALSNYDKLDVCNIINSASEPYLSKEALLVALDKACDDINNKKPIIKDDSPSGGGPSIGKVSQSVTKNEEHSKVEFTDLGSAEWASEAVNILAKKGIVSGVGENKFAPDRNVLREEFVKMLIKALDINTIDKTIGFLDVDEKSWYAPFVSAAVENGIVTGTTDGKFGVGCEITREEMAAMVYRAVKTRLNLNVSQSDDVFVDESYVSDYAKEACAYVKNAGIIQGFGDNSFKPKEKATRAQTAKVIFEIMKQGGLL